MKIKFREFGDLDRAQFPGRPHVVLALRAFSPMIARWEIDAVYDAIAIMDGDGLDVAVFNRDGKQRFRVRVASETVGLAIAKLDPDGRFAALMALPGARKVEADIREKGANER